MSKPKKRLTQETPKSREKPLGERDLGIEVKEVGVPLESNQSSLVKSDSSFCKLTKWVKPTPEVMTKVYEDMSTGLSLKSSCALHGVDYIQVFQRMDRPAYVWLRGLVSRAEAAAARYWQNLLRPPYEDKFTSGSQVKAAMFMLGAIDKERYRENYQGSGPGVVVQIIQGSGRGDPVNAVQVQVRDSAGNQIKSNKRDSIDGQQGHLSAIGLPEITVRQGE